MYADQLSTQLWNLCVRVVILLEAECLSKNYHSRDHLLFARSNQPRRAFPTTQGRCFVERSVMP